MRVLVVGAYPPTPDPVGPVVLDHARLLRRDGYDVTVLSPTPSAAHFAAAPATPRGAAELARLARGSDLVVVHYTSDLAPASGPRVVRTAVRTALRRTLGPVGRLEVVIHRVDQHDDGAFLELLRGCDARFTVADITMATRLDARGIRLPNVRVDEAFALPAPPPAPPEQWPDRVPALQAAIQVRAASTRADLHHAELDRLRASTPIRLSLPTSSRPGLTTVRRLLQRLTAWEMDPLVGQVNRLRGAMLDLLDSGGRDPGQASSGSAARTAARNDEPSSGQS